MIVEHYLLGEKELLDTSVSRYLYWLDNIGYKKKKSDNWQRENMKKREKI